MRTLTATLLVPLLLSLATSAAASLPLEAQRVAPPAQLKHQGKKSALLPRRQFDPGDLITTGRNGRAALLLEGSGLLVLGDESELYIHSVEGSGEGYGALARMALMRGSLRLDTTPRPDLPPQDMRLNVGTLRVRVLGAEVWANVEPGLNQTVCLLQGTVEILSDVGNETLDNPGDCFRYGTNNVRMRLRPDADATLARKLARTAFAGETPLGTPPVAIAAPQPRVQKPTPLEMEILGPTPEFIASQTPPQAEEPAAVVATAPPPAAPVVMPPAALPDAPAVPVQVPEWTVVVASLKKPAAAEQEASRLQAKGYAAQVTRMPNGFHRVYIGRFGSPTLAHAYAKQLRSDEKLQTWIEPSSRLPAALQARAESAPAPAATTPAIELAAAPPSPAPEAPVAAEPAPTTPPAAPAAVASDAEWTVIVASLRNGEAAEREANRLNAKGLSAQICPAANGNYRVCVGRFETRELARIYSVRLRETDKLQGWVAKTLSD